MDTTLHDPLIGRLVDGRYRVEERIAVGGMATVYRATDLRLDRVVALKVMHPSLAEDGGFVERFIREARSVARLDHPNIVGVLDQGTDEGYVYLAMEYVAGCTLRDALRERGSLPPRAVLDILQPMLAGLGAAHRAGLVHRDVKPENVLIGDDGRVKVADFGLVRGVDSTTSATTDSLLGTVSYLAPEQIERGTVDARTDVFACGLLLYEMLTGERPQAGETAAQLLYARLNEDVPLPSAAVPELAPELDGLVARASARDRDTRPADAAAMLSLVQAVRAVLSEEQLDVDAGPGPAPVAAVGAGGEALTERLPRAAGVGPDDRTAVVPLPEGVLTSSASNGGPAVERTSRIELPADGQPPVPSLLGPSRAFDDGDAFQGDAVPPARRPAPRRRVLGLVLLALLVIGAGAGVWYINSGQFLRTPGVVGLAEAEASERLRDAGLDVTVREDFSQVVPVGHVISSDPERGERVRRNSTVTLTVSQGPPVAAVPNVRGLPLDEATSQLREAGLTPGEEIRDFSEEVPRGSVISTTPAPGEEVRPNTAVDLVVSRGAEIDVPGVVGLPEGTAAQRLRDAGFEVEVAPERVHSQEEAGTVARQTPAGGTTAGAGDTVTLTVSRGPEMIVVPDVRGLDEDEAVEILQEAGFEVNVNRLFFTGTVFNQSVHSGDRAARGSTITIWVR
ncbi:Stk1 family PASTA domain-containing Ser/Thr kinase [Streptomyces sp. 4N509B]|uniref:Stk1 family PASTA domain-containing Ser/Thr kinase n=1 Tax=Streptomyces sp. 4N509B TaxID=3457413 RepID=UPI003FD2B970